DRVGAADITQRSIGAQDGERSLQRLIAVKVSSTEPEAILVPRLYRKVNRSRVVKATRGRSAAIHRPVIHQLGSRRHAIVDYVRLEVRGNMEKGVKASPTVRQVKRSRGVKSMLEVPRPGRCGFPH